MIYLDGNIGAIYLNKYWHERAYLGSVLVWNSNPDWRRSGEASAKVAFVTTSQGISAILLPATTVSNILIGPEVSGVSREASNVTSNNKVSLLHTVTDDIVTL